MKLQSFFIMKFSSSRLKYSNYKIDIKIKEARLNNEVIRVGNSPLISEINRIRGIRDDEIFREVSFAEKEIKKIKKRKNSLFSFERLEKLTYVVEKYLFIDSIIYVHFDNIKHYNGLMKSGLFINGFEYVRLVSSAGNARQQNVVFVKKELYDNLIFFIEAGRNEEYKIGESKYSAYAGLSTSAGHKVKFPRIAVIKDYKINRKTSVDFVTNKDNEEPFVEEGKILDLEFVPFDGMGICSKSYMNNLSYELDMEFVPSWFIFRSAWLKGMVCSIDFNKFSEENFVGEITDIYGKIHNICDIDIILTESQFKLSGAYKDFESYVSEIEKRDYGFWITRTSPKKEKKVATSNYQYLQCLNLSDENIEELCLPTVNYLKDVSGLSWEKTILFLIGSLEKEDINLNWWKSLDPLVRILITSPEFMNNNFVKNKIKKMISRKIKDSYIGSLRLFANYQVMISDPVAFLQHAFCLPVKGLLKEGEAFSSFWNKEKTEKISALRSPMTYRSEINVLNLKNTEEMNDWFSHLSGIVYNVFDDSDMKHAGSDRDGDLVMTTNNKYFIENIYGGLPVTYNRKSASKVVIDRDILWKSDQKVFKNKIGYITNLSTTLYSMLALYDENSTEGKVIINRLKNLTCQQSREIDKGKGILVEDIPDWWAKYTSTKNKELSTLEKETVEFRNKILADKRPYFFRHLYQHYEKEYKKYLGIYNTFCISNYGVTLEQLQEKENPTKEQRNTLYYFHRYNHLIDTPSVMNKVCHHMEEQVSLLKDARNDVRFAFSVDEDKIEKMKEIYKEWKILRKKHAQEGGSLLSHEIKRKVNEISVNINEIAKLSMNVSVGFAFSVFPEYVEELYKKKSVQVPVLDENGDIEFDGEKYSIVVLDLEDYG